MLLLGWGASAQVYHIDCKTDSLAGIIVSKDAKISELGITIKKNRKSLREAVNTLHEANNTIDSLEYYKYYYNISKNILSPRIIARIEDEIIID